MGLKSEGLQFWKSRTKKIHKPLRDWTIQLVCMVFIQESKNKKAEAAESASLLAVSLDNGL